MSLKNLNIFKPELIVEETSAHEHGDGCFTKFLKKSEVVEENNNDIDALASDFSKMGNITKKCSESSRKMSNDSGDYNYDVREIKSTLDGEHNAVEQSGRKSQQKKNYSSAGHGSLDYEYASDDFEEDSETKSKDNIPNPEVKNIVDKVSMKLLPRSPKEERESKIDRLGMETRRITGNELTRFQSNHDKVEQDYSVRSQSRCSFSSGSTMRKQRKINMSFSNERSMEIERQNCILLRKILRSRSSRSNTPSTEMPRNASASIIRKREQDKIQHENMILLRKIQRAKPSKDSMRK